MTSPLFSLIGLVEENTDEATIKFGRANHHREELEEELTFLQGYRNELATRPQIDLRPSRDQQPIRNVQLFLSKIDDAIKKQQQLIAYAQKQLQVERQRWQEQERKKNSACNAGHEILLNILRG